MRTIRGRAAWAAGMPRRLILFACILLLGLVSGFGAAAAQTLEPAGHALDARLLFTIGTAIGVMAFAIGTSIFYLRGMRQAQEASEIATAEAQALRNRKNRLEAILAAEPQMLFAWNGSADLKLLIANLPQNLGVPSQPELFLHFGDWMDGDSAAACESALHTLLDKGEAFNLMARTQQGKMVEIDGRTAGSSVSLKVRDLAGQRLDLATLAADRKRQDNEALALKTLLNSLPTPAWVRNEMRRLVWANQAYTEATGAGTTARVVDDQVELLGHDVRHSVETALLADGRFEAPVDVAANHGVERYEAHIVTSAGTEAGLMTEAGADNAQETLELRGFDRMTTAFAMFDARQRLVHFNQAYAQLWDLDPAWLASGPSDGEILDRLRLSRRLPEKADYQTWKRGWLEAYGKNSQFDDEWHLPDGRTLHVLIDSAETGGVTYLFENVTERLALESRYNALIQVQRETLDTLREGVAVFAPDGTLRLYNRAFAAIWHLSPHQLEGEPHIEEIIQSCRALYDNPEEWERTKASVTAIVAERRPYESQFDRPDGSVIAAAALPLPDGRTLLTYVDVSDSVRAERALRERNEALEEASRVKSRFVGHVSYELRTPLNNIIGFADMIAMPGSGPLTAKQHEYLNDIRTSGNTLRALINDILDLTSIDAGVLELDLSVVSVSEVIAALQSALADRLKQAGVQLQIAIAPDLDRFVADEQRLTQILYNLLSNAIAFSPKGSAVQLSSRIDCNGMLAFTVRDHGAGIPEAYQAQIFEPFESQSNGSGHRGAGLGLAIVKSLVELHGGDIALTSAPDHGTEVTVWLPLETQADDSMAPAPISRAV